MVGRGGGNYEGNFEQSIKKFHEIKLVTDIKMTLSEGSSAQGEFQCEEVQSSQSTLKSLLWEHTPRILME